MKISREWLNDFLDVSALSDDEIAQRLTSIGHAVEGIEKHGDDSVFEIEFTTNRIDAMSHQGLARELGAAIGRPIGEAAAGELYPSPEGVDVAIRIDAPQMCARYSALIIKGVKVGPSSERVRQRLEAVGLHSINNVVDATNYVMMAIGHPLHAFDLNRLAGRAVIVRGGIEGETITTLDGIERRIDPQTIVISDAEKAVALGGVMGGRNSEISESTTDLLLECAWFEPSMIRRTARRLGLKTDASYRFERGADPGDTLRALSMAAALIEAEAGGERGECIDVVSEPRPVRSILLRDELLERATANRIPRSEASELLRAIGMTSVEADHGLTVEIPSWRSDIFEEMDLVEELLRFHGYGSIDAELPRIPAGDVRHDAIADLEESVRDDLVAAGLAEVVNYAFVHPEWNEAISDEQPVAVTNALNENISSMRLSPIPGLLETVQHNRAYGTRDGAVFEVGRTYHWKGEQVTERRVAAFALFGNRPVSWGDTRAQWNYFDAKGIVERIARRYNVTLAASASDAGWLERGAALKTDDGALLACVGLPSRRLLDLFELRSDVIVAQVDLCALAEARRSPRMSPVSKFPGIPMVVPIMHGPDLRFGEIVDAIRGMEVPHLRDIGLWDRFVQPGSDEVKTAIGLWYQADDRSLTQEEVASANQAMAEKLTKRLGVRLANSQ